MASSRASSQPKDRTGISCLSCTPGRFFTAEPPGKPQQPLLYTPKREDKILIYCQLIVLFFQAFFKLCLLHTYSIIKLKNRFYVSKCNCFFDSFQQHRLHILNYSKSFMKTRFLICSSLLFIHLLDPPQRLAGICPVMLLERSIQLLEGSMNEWGVFRDQQKCFS